MDTLKSYFYMSYKRMNRKGECPVYCRVSLNEEQRCDFSTGIFLKPQEWDRKRSAPANNNRQAITRIAEIQKGVYASIAHCESKSVYAPREIVLHYKNASQKTVYTIVNITQELLQRERPSEQSSRKISIAVAQFVNICGQDVYSHTPETIKGFVNEAAKTMSMVTVKKKLEYIKRVFCYAFNQGYIGRNPFAGFRMPAMPRLHHTQLSDQELQQLTQKQLHAKRLDQVRDLFLFQCYTGLSYSDLAQLRPDMVVERSGVKFLYGERKKTGNRFMLPFTPQAAAIADRYNYTLPMLTNQKYNAYLKEIADLCGIDKRLTTHVGRKTFAQIMINQGYTAESVSLMMGHASFNMTQKHYARISEVRIEREVLKMAG